MTSLLTLAIASILATVGAMPQGGRMGMRGPMGFHQGGPMGMRQGGHMGMRQGGPMGMRQGGPMAGPFGRQGGVPMGFPGQRFSRQGAGLFPQQQQQQQQHQHGSAQSPAFGAPRNAQQILGLGRGLQGFQNRNPSFLSSNPAFSTFFNPQRSLNKQNGLMFPGARPQHPQMHVGFPANLQRVGFTTQAPAPSPSVYVAPAQTAAPAPAPSAAATQATTPAPAATQAATEAATQPAPVVTAQVTMNYGPWAGSTPATPQWWTAQPAGQPDFSQFVPQQPDFSQFQQDQPDFSQFVRDQPDLSEMAQQQQPDFSQFQQDQPDFSQFVPQQPDFSQLAGQQQPPMNQGADFGNWLQQQAANQGPWNMFGDDDGEDSAEVDVAADADAESPLWANSFMPMGGSQGGWMPQGFPMGMFPFQGAADE